MDTKFTPAPWVAAGRGDYSDYDGNSRVILGDDMRVAVVQHHGDVRDEANANLIAAAPDLYEALVETDHILRRAEFFYQKPLVELRKQITAALAKARGEQS